MVEIYVLNMLKYLTNPVYVLLSCLTLITITPWTLATETSSSEVSVKLNACCSSQFSYRHGQCHIVEHFNRLKFPAQVFGKYSFQQQLPSCQETERLVVPIQKISLSEAGYFQYGTEFYPPTQYCFDSIGPKTAELIISSKSKCLLRLLNKCCDLDFGFDIDAQECYPSTNLNSKPWTQISSYILTRRKLRCRITRNFTSEHCWTWPVKYLIQNPDSNQPYSSLEYESQDGVFLRGAWKTLEYPDYCVERLQNHEDLCVGKGSSSSEVEVVFFCSHDETTSLSYATLLGWLWLVTSVFLLLAAIVNVSIVQKNVHGWVLFCYLVSSSLLNQVAAAFVFIVDDERVGCYFVDFATKFLYLSTLCWMTMVNFDLWWAFRILDRKLEPSAIKSTKRLPFYFIFAWTVPSFIITLCWFLGKVRRESKSHCILYDYSLILYSSGPVVLLIVFNLVLFLRTAMIIQEIRRTTQNVLQRSSRVERESFKLFSKLFLMSGPIWVLRVVLLILQVNGNYLTWYGFLIEVIFIVPDISFFLLVILHRNVRTWLQGKFPRLRGVPFCTQKSPVSRPNSQSPEFSSSVRRLGSLPGGIVLLKHTTPNGNGLTSFPMNPIPVDQNGIEPSSSSAADAE